MPLLDDRWQVVEVSRLQKAPWNYKEDDAVLDEKLDAGIKKNGVIVNLIVRELKGDKLEVVNGNHRLTVIQKQGIKKVMVVNLGKIPLHQAQLVAVETNELAYESNQLKLAEMLRGISDKVSTEDLLKTLPYDPEHLEGFLKAPVFDTSVFTAHKEHEAITGVPAVHEAPPAIEPPDAPGRVPPSVVGEAPGYEFVRVPKDVWGALSGQLKRLNKALSADGQIPKEELENAGFGLAFQVMAQHFAEKSDDALAALLKPAKKSTEKKKKS